MNFTDRHGLYRSLLEKTDDEEDEEGWDPGFVFGLLLQRGKARYGPVTGDVEKMSEFSRDRRSAAHQAIANMSAGCKNALRDKFNLFNGLSSLLGKTDPANPNAVKFYNARDTNVANTPMSDWGLRSSMLTGEFLDQPGYAAFVSQYQGRASNDIVLGGQFFTQTAHTQSALLIHEVLHAYTGDTELDLATKLNLRGFIRDVDASKGITTYFDVDCDINKWNERMGIQ